jgi:MFS family permease
MEPTQRSPADRPPGPQPLVAGTASRTKPDRHELDPSVRALGFVSLLNDFGSEVILRTLPLFLSNVLGVKTGVIGMIEGIAESASTLLRPLAGAAADRWGRRKPLAVAGYLLSALSRPVLLFATTWGWVLGFRVADRVGKAMRTPPRDALIADLTPPQHRGHAFGFNRALDEVGAVAGMLVAAAIVFGVQRGAAELDRETWMLLAAVASVPGFFAVAVIVRWVREAPVAPETRAPLGAAAPPRMPLSALGRPFALYLVWLIVFSLGNSSDAFLMLRGQSVGVPLGAMFLVLAGFSLTTALSSIPGGVLSDRFGRRRLMVTGALIYAAIYWGFSAATAAWHIVALYVAYGLYYGAFQGAAMALVADLVPRELRATAYGFVHAAVGITAFPASAIAGALWQWLGPPAPFLLGSALALVAGIGFAFLPAAPRARVG